MSPTIFISHSCKDGETAPPAGLSADEVAARQARLTFARALRTKLVHRLGDGGRRAGEPKLHAYLDRRDLRGGDLWRTGLHEALGTSAGGVILLSPESIESKWVLKEATILTWRAFADRRVVVVPVILGVSDADLAARGFEPLGLDQIQWVKVDDPSDAELDRAVEETIASLARIPPNPLASAETLSPIDRWIEELAEQLTAVAPGRSELRADTLRQMFDALAISQDERELGLAATDPYLALARQAFVATGDQILDLVNHAGGSEAPKRAAIKSSVAPIWVEPAPASRLFHAAQPGAVIAVDATEMVTLHDYVLRAYCNKIRPDRIVKTTDVLDGTVDQVAAEVERALEAQGWYVDELREEVDAGDPILVLLGPGSARPDVLAKLTADFSPVTFIVAAGSAPEKKLRDWTRPVTVLRPGLQPSRERAGRKLRTKLRIYVEQGVSQ